MFLMLALCNGNCRVIFSGNPAPREGIVALASIAVTFPAWKAATWITQSFAVAFPTFSIVPVICRNGEFALVRLSV